MTKHTDSCTWPRRCAFIEYESTDCLIPEKSGYKDEESREYTDGDRISLWAPCEYYVNWDDAIKLIIDGIERRREE